MADKTAIEWAANADGSPGATWNPIRARNRATGKVGWFCTRASPGCEHCYAEAINHRLGTGVAFKAQNAGDVEIFLDERTLTQPLRWKRPRTIFVCSMTDLFGDFVTDHMIDAVFAIMALCPQHTFIVLTKRAARLRTYIEATGVPLGRQHELRLAVEALTPFKPDKLGEHPQTTAARIRVSGSFAKGKRPLPNVWLGISAEDQRRADARIPDLLATPAAVRFVSLEPLLGPIELDEALHGESGLGLDWVIVGGESGRGARPMHPDWARSLRDQCDAAGVPFFFKQWGEWGLGVERGDDGYAFHLMPGASSAKTFDDFDGVTMARVGKLAAGRVLDGRTHDDRPPLAGAPSCP